MPSLTPSNASRSERALDEDGFFLGRQKELNWLRQAWEQAVQGKPQIRILTAESGYGKTALAQAFYGWLSSDYDPDHYWPKALLSEGRNLHVMPEMRGINPNAVMPWFWWGLRFFDTTTRNSTSSDSPFFRSLSEPDFVAQKEALLQVLHRKKAFNKAGMAALKGLLSCVPGAAPFSEGLQALSELWDNWGIIRDQRDRLLLTKMEESRRIQIKSILAIFKLLLDPSEGEKKAFPVVLLLDDAQWMDADSLEILRSLWSMAVAGGLPLLILATNWQKEWNLGFRAESHQPASDEAPAGGSLLFARWVCEQQDSAVASAIKVHPLGKLAETRKLLIKAFPGLDEQSVIFLQAETAGNPEHMNELIKWLRGRPHLFQDRDPTRSLVPDWRTHLTKAQLDLHLLQSQRFDAIQESLKELLGAASIQGDRFLQEFTLEVASELGMGQDAGGGWEGNNPLRAAQDPHALAQALDETYMEFCSPNIRKCALAYLEECGARENAARIVVDCARRWIDHGRLLGLPLPTQLFLLEIGRRGAEESADRLSQGRFIAEALVRTKLSGLLSNAATWVSAWEILALTEDELGMLDFWSLCDLVMFFDFIGEMDLAWRLAFALGSHPKAQGTDDEVGLRARSAVLELQASLWEVAGEDEKALACLADKLEIARHICKRYGDTPRNLEEVAGLLCRMCDLEWEVGLTTDVKAHCYESLALRFRVLKFGETACRIAALTVSMTQFANVRQKLEPLSTSEMVELARHQQEYQNKLQRYAEVEQYIVKRDTDALQRGLRSAQSNDAPDLKRAIIAAHLDLCKTYTEFGLIQNALPHAEHAYALANQVVDCFGSTQERDKEIKDCASRRDWLRARYPRRSQMLRLCNVSEKELRLGDISRLDQYFEDAESHASVSRLWCNCALYITCVDPDPRSNYLIPEIRHFIQALYKARPHVLYFFTLDNGGMNFNLKSLLAEEFLDMSADGNSAEFGLSPRKFAAFAARHLKPAIDFAESAGIKRQKCYARYSRLFNADIWNLMHEELSK